MPCGCVKRVLSPELQECMDANEGSAATSAHGPKSPETPCKGEELSAGGELAHQSGVNTKGGARNLGDSESARLSENQ